MKSTVRALFLFSVSLLKRRPFDFNIGYLPSKKIESMKNNEKLRSDENWCKLEIKFSKHLT